MGKYIKLLILALGFAAAVWQILQKKSVLWERNPGNRDYCYDWIRTLAVVMIFMMHSCGQTVLSTEVTHSQSVLFNVISCMFQICNPIYIMLSGALLLEDRKESAAQFYKKRMTRLFFPAVFYIAWLLSYSPTYRAEELSSLKNAAVYILSGRIYRSSWPQLWFLYVIFILYLATPILRRILKKISVRGLTLAAAFSMAVLLILSFFPEFGTDLHSFRWLLVYYLGYWVSRRENEKFYGLLKSTGIVSLILIGILTWLYPGKIQLTLNTAPLAVIAALGVYAWIFSARAFFEKKNAVVYAVSRYSYSMILIHWYVLFYIMRDRFHIHMLRYGVIGGSILTVGGALVISFIIVFAGDNLWSGACLAVRKIARRFDHKQ